MRTMHTLYPEKREVSEMYPPRRGTMRGYTRYGSGRNVIYCRTVRASLWDPAYGVRGSGTWEARIHRSMYSATTISGRGWRYVVVRYFGPDEKRIAEGITHTLREAMDAADAALASGRAALAASY